MAPCRVSLILVLAAAMFTSTPADSATIRVPENFASIAEATNAAAPGDTILVGPGTYSDVVVIDKSLAYLAPAGRDSTFLQPVRMIIWPPEFTEVKVRVAGFTFRGSLETPVSLSSSGTTRPLLLEVRDCRFNQNGGAGAYGGAIDVEVDRSVYTQLDIHDCIFEQNTAIGWGGAINIRGLLMGSIADNTFIGNSAQQRGGAIACTSVNGPAGGPPHYRIERNEFKENSAPFEGGAIAMWAVSRFVQISDNRFENNRSGLHGGAVAAFGSCGDILIQDNLLVANGTSDLGGGIAVIESGANVSRNTMDGNLGARGGGLAVFSFLGTNFVERNIVANAPAGSGIFYSGSAPGLMTSCNDSWNNAAGEYEGFVPTPTDFSLDPEFCDPLLGDYQLRASSPCAPDHSPAECGLVGALPVGCAVTSVADEVPIVAPLLTVVPNPVRGAARFELQANSAAGRLRIFDSQGRMVERLLPSGGHWEWVPGSSFPAGIYFAVPGEGVSATGAVKFLYLR